MVVLNVRRVSRTPDNCGFSLTVGELAGFLSELDPEQTIIVGSCFLSESEGWYWYSGISESDVKEVDLNERGDVAFIGDAW